MAAEALSDTAALDQIALLLARTADWRGDTASDIADIVARTVRDHPGDSTWPYLLPGDRKWPVLPDDYSYARSNDDDHADMHPSVATPYGVMTFDHPLDPVALGGARELMVHADGETHAAWYSVDRDELTTDPDSADFWRPRGELVMVAIATSRAIYRDGLI